MKRLPTPTYYEPNYRIDPTDHYTERLSLLSSK